ncbi:MAG: CARDB domain-containing protein [Candidatus Bathyarchaeia archaeon]
MNQKAMIMKGQVLVLLLLFFTLSVLAVFQSCQTVQASNNVRILSHNGWIDLIGQYHVSGEIENCGSVPLRVKVSATFYDSKGNAIVTRSTSDDEATILDVLLPGRKTPFDIIAYSQYSGDIPAELIDHYTLDVTYSVADPIPIGLKILSSKPTVELGTYLRISGLVQNVANESARVVIIACFYDSEGRVAVYRYDVGIIYPRETRSFTIQPNFVLSSPFGLFRHIFPATSYYLTAEARADKFWGGKAYAVESEETGSISREPPKFKVTELTINPSTAKPGETVRVSVKIINEGGAKGSHTLNLKVNGTLVNTKTVTLEGKETTTITFEVTKEVEGTYVVEVDGIKGSFKVTATSASLEIGWPVIVAVTAVVTILATTLLIYMKRKSSTKG